MTIAAGKPSDVEEMAELWSRVAPGHQLAHVLDTAGLATWIDAAPSLDLSRYLLARRPDGGLEGFLAVWDQSAFKRLRVTGYSPKLAAVRTVFNALAPALGSTRLPPTGGALRNLTAVHVCVPPEEPGVLRALVLDAYNAARGQGFSFLNVGLDAADPLSVAMKGLLAQPLDIWICVASLAENLVTTAFDGRPFHHEIALV